MRRLLVGLALIFAFLVGTAWYVLTSPDTEISSGVMDDSSDDVFTSENAELLAAPTTLSQVQGAEENLDPDPTTTEAEQETSSAETADDDTTESTSGADSDGDDGEAETETQATSSTNTSTTTSTGATNTPSSASGPSQPYAVPNDTGIGVPAATLTNVGSRAELTYVVDTPGAVIEGQNIEGCLLIEADDVTVRNSRITCRSDRTDIVSGIEIPTGVTGTEIVSNNIVCTATGSNIAPCSAGIRGSNFTARLNNISGGVNGILTTGPNVTATRNYIHSLRTGTDPWQATGQSFNNGLRSYGGANISFVGNYLEGSTGSVRGVFIQPESLAQGGNTPTAVVRDNYITGSWQGGIECRSHTDNSFAVDCNVQGNIIADGLPGTLIHISTDRTSRVACNRLIGGGFVANSQIFGATQNNNSCS